MDQDRIARIIPKLHWRLMPTLLMMYVLAFLDRANVGFAREGFQANAGIGDAAFAFGASIFFVGYALLEVPSNLILYKVGARLWMCRIMVTWGLVSAATAFVEGPTSYYVLRFLLGITEAGFFPGVIFYLTTWYPRGARASSVGIFFYGAPIALSLGGPISGMLVAHDAFRLHGWQMMFLVEGLAASLAGIAVLFLLHDGPARAPWLDADEKRVLLETLAEEERVAPRKHDVRQALRDPRLLFLALVYFLIQMGFYGLTFYLPSQVAALLGTGIGAKVGFVSALPWITALVAVTLIPRWCDRHDNARGAGAFCMAMAGVALLVSAVTPSPLLALAALCVAAGGLIVAPALFWSMPTAILGGAAAAGGIGLINSIGNLGGFVAPNLRAWLEIGFHSPGTGLIGLAIGTVIGAAAYAAAPRR
ncbi:MAG: MFS transporter [Alphaproteobacteria bacterium 64-11]|nr:MFS transporter [Alphaproteobacteria bacterium]OJU14179.1 MAG: MFS transporter [Alphaproteobacteria bacterium 64-11]